MKKYVNLLSGVVVFLISVAFVFTVFSTDKLLVKSLEKNSITIQKLRTLDSNWSLSALSAHNNSLSNFDRLASFLPKVRRLRNELANEELSDDAEFQEIKNKQSQFLFLLQGKEDVIEEFKSNFAVIRNSLRYLPLAVDALSGEETTLENEYALIQETRQVFNRINKFLNSPTEEGRRQILSSLVSLEQSSISVSVENANVIANFSSHARAVVDRKIMFETVLNKLTDLGVNAVGGELVDLYHKKINSEYKALKEKQLYQEILFALLALVALSVCVFACFDRRKQSEYFKREFDFQASHYEKLESKNSNPIVDKSLSENLAGMGNMAATVAHEINTPLGYIGSNLQMLDSGMSDVQTLMDEFSILEDDLSKNEDKDYTIFRLRSFLDLIGDIKNSTVLDELNEISGDLSRGVDQIQHIVDDLKNFTRKDQLSNDEFNIADCISSALKMSGADILNDVKVVRDVGNLPSIYGSPAEINQVLINLINNAVHALEGEHEGQKIIKLKAIQNKNNIIVSVVDNGCGFSEEIRAKIFDPFFTTKDVGKGTGLGLSIVRRIVGRHKGKVVVKSVLAKGTNVTFSLPINK